MRILLKTFTFIVLITYISSCKQVIYNDNNNTDELLTTRNRTSFGPICWSIIHSVAQSLSSTSTSQEKAALNDFVNGIRTHFPCQECRGHFKNMTDEYPLDNRGRNETGSYFCERHNQVNIRLNKTVFDCSRLEEVYGVKSQY